MLGLKEQSLRDALKATGLRDLPKKYDAQSDEIWVEAIVLTKKADLTQTYALAHRRGDGLVTYTKDFGRMSPIVGLVGVYPYMYLDKERFFYYASREEKIRSIRARMGENKAKEAETWPDERIDALLIDEGIKEQKESLTVDIHNNALEEGEHLEAVAEEVRVDAREAVKADKSLEIIETPEGEETMKELMSAKPSTGRRGRKPKGTTTRKTTKKK